MTIVRSLLIVIRTCPCCGGLGKILVRSLQATLTAEYEECPHCEGRGSVEEKDGL